MQDIDQLERDATRARSEGDWPRVLTLAEDGLAASDRTVFKVCRFQALAALGRKQDALAFADGLDVQDKLGGMLLPLAQLLRETGRLQDVVDLLGQAPKHRLESFLPLEMYYGCLSEIHGVNTAISRLRQDFEPIHHHPEAAALLGDLLLGKGQNGEAETLQRQALSEKPELALPLARRHLAAGRAQRARDTILDAIDRMPASPPMMVTLSWACIKTGTPKLALPHVGPLIRDGSNHLTLNTCYWILLFVSGEVAAARENSLDFADRFDTDHAIQVTVARFLRQRGFLDDAKAILDRMKALAPEAEQTLLADIDLSARMGRNERALRICERAMGLFPESIPFRVARLQAMFDLGRSDMALQDDDIERESVRLGPLLLPICDALIQDGKADQAAALVKLASEKRPLKAGERALEIRCLLETAGAQASLKRLVEICAEGVTGPAVSVMACRVIAAAGEDEKALDELALDWTTPPAILSRANLLLDRDAFDDAVTLLQARKEDIEHLPAYWLALVQALVGLGRHRNCLAILRDAVGRFPENIHVQSAYWRHLVANNRKDDAIAAAAQFGQETGEDETSQVVVADFFAMLEEWEICKETLDRLANSNPNDLKIILKICQFLERQDDIRTAQSVLSEFMETRPWTADSVGAMARLEAKLGDELAAIDRLRAFLDDNPQSHRCRAELIQLLLENNQVQEARRHLEMVKATGGAAAIRIRSLEAEAAFQSGQRNRAEAMVEAALRLAPETPYLLQQLSRYRLLLGNINGAWRDHSEASSLIARRDISRRRSAKPMKSVQGQLLNEFRLHGIEIDFSHCAEEASRPAALKHFKQVISKNPGNLPAAIYLFDTLKREPPRGATDAGVSGKPRIPKTVFQFWDQRNPPPEIQAIMAANQQMNPDYRFEIYDSQRALDYLRDKQEAEAVRGFRLAPSAAAKADIFRLAVLFHEGGVYMDADDGALAPLGQHLNHARRFVGYYESTLTVGNNFLAVRPRDPIIRFALSAAATAFDGPRGEPLWMASGPAVITRALAIEGTRSDGRLKAGIEILRLGELRRFIAPHIRVPYKSTNTHWVRAMTHREGVL